MRSIFRSLELMDSTLDDLHSDRIMVILPPTNSTASTTRNPLGDTNFAVELTNNTINTSLCHQLVFNDIKSNNTLLYLLQPNFSLLTTLEYYTNATNHQTPEGAGLRMKYWKSFVHQLTRGFRLLPSH